MTTALAETDRNEDAPRTTEAFGRAPLEQVREALDAPPGGLSSDEAKRRLERYGPNELRRERRHPIRRFLSYFWGPIPWMIEVAMILSAMVRHWPDFGIILALLLANGLVAFWEEYQAGNTIEALEARLAPNARARRDGKWLVVPARELVPGDRIRIRLGEVIPADARLVDGDPIEVDQSALTGESLPVTRSSGEAVYSGAVVQRGEVDALVYATGEKTYFGETARLVESVHGTSHLQHAILKIGDYLIVLALLLVTIIVGAALLRGDPIVETLQFALVLCVAAIPVALPTVLSVTMAVGARMLAAKEAIVTRLSATEEMAGIDVLCSDKTGTLTKNRLTLGDPFLAGGAGEGDLLLAGGLASRAEDRDAIDLAVLGGLDDPRVLDAYEVVHFRPFDPVGKRTEATIRDRTGKTFRVAKGAPQVILEIARGDADLAAETREAVAGFAARGYRALGVARDDGDGDWRFLGLLSLYDPPQEDSAETIAAARRMGVRIKMVTGDQAAIGREIARQVGLGTNIVDADALDEGREGSPLRLQKMVEEADGFAQVFPEHKFHIVEALQAKGHIVGMTGDGVNDAPALKRADVGVAVAGATDAARAAADIVLLRPGLSVIVDAIRSSRRIFRRMYSYALYRITETIRVLFFMTLSILAFHFYPVTAIMIVLLAILNDGAILSIAYDRVKESDHPESWDMPVVLAIATVLGIVGVAASFGLFYLGDRVVHMSREMLQTLMYLKLSVSGHLTIFATRTRGPFWSTRPAAALFGAVLGTQMLATLIAALGIFMTPIGWRWAMIVWGYALVAFFVEDRAKLGAYRVFGRGQPALLARAHR